VNVTARAVVYLSACFFAFVVCAAEVYPQSSTISGNITDASGAVVPGVHVTVLETRQNIGRHTESNAFRRFFRAASPSGVLCFHGPEARFRHYRDSGCRSGIGRRHSRQYPNKCRSTATNRCGECGGHRRASGYIEPGSIVVQISVQNLPLNGRNFINLVQLTAGANGAPPRV